MAITLKEVAARAGVSRSAVSRTFTDGASVSDKMRRKVERAARELGYRPNALASSLTTGRTKLIGLVSNNFRNPIFLEVFDLFTRALQDCGLRPLQGRGALRQAYLWHRLQSVHDPPARSRPRRRDRLPRP